MALTQISTAGVKDDAVTSGKIPANAVGSSELADNAVDTAAITDNAVTTAKIAGSAVSTGAIADSAVTTAKIAGSAVTSGAIASDAVTTAKIAGSAVTSGAIATNAVTTAKITDGSVTASKLASGITDLVSDTSPQLGGHLDTNGSNIDFLDNNKAAFGNGNDLQIYHDGTHSYLSNGTGNLFVEVPESQKFQVQHGSESIINGYADDRVELYHDNVKQLETTENGILLNKGCIRGLGGSKVIIGGTINPANDATWNFSFGTNDNGYNQGYVFNVKFYVNHWNGGNYYKYIESIVGGRGNVTGLDRLDLINNLGGNASSGWPNGHLDYSVSLTGGTRDGNNVSLFKVTFDSDGSPAYTSGYYLEVSYSNQIGTISIT